MKRLIRRAFRSIGLDIITYKAHVDGQRLPSDIDGADRSIIERVAGFTMTSLERQIALVQSIRYLVRHEIQGCIVECGVWRGGSTMAAALTLIDERDATRNLYLYDTFQGMPPPTDVDQSGDGTPAQSYLDCDPERTGNVWAVAGFDDVRRNVEATGYSTDRVRYVKGLIESTLPAESPTEPIALLRLDTDWYESTRHELEHLYPLLCIGGILIIDDYGHWQGARKAVDEYFNALGKPYFLHRIDYTGRLLVKCAC